MPKPRKVLGARGKAARKTERAKLGKLGDNLVLNSTLLRYNKALIALFDFSAMTYQRKPQNNYELDLFMCAFIENLWESGDPRQIALDVVSGMAHHLEHVRSSMRGARRLYTAWGKKELPARALPLSPHHIHAFVAYWALVQKNARFAVILWLAFDCFLRTVEFSNVTKSDLVLDLPRGRGVLRLRVGKTVSRLGADEGLIIENRSLIQMLAVVTRPLAAGDRILPFSDSLMRRNFAETCRHFELDPDDFKPYSLRRGGATAYYRALSDMPRTVLRGRWGDARTALIYIQESLALCADIRESESMRKRFEFHSERLHSLFI